MTTSASTPKQPEPPPASPQIRVGLQRLHVADAFFHVLVDGEAIALVDPQDHRVTLIAPRTRVLVDGARSGAPFNDRDFVISSPWIEGDRVAFQIESGRPTDGLAKPPPHRCGIYLTSPTGTQEIASWRTSVPGQRGTFSCVGAPVIRGGTVYFTGAVGNDWAGLYAWTSGQLRAVVSMSTPLPDGRKFIGAFSYLNGQRDQLRVSYELDSGDRGILLIDDRDAYTASIGGGWPPGDFYDASLTAPYGPVGFGPIIRGDRIAFLGPSDDPASDLRACVHAVHGATRTRLVCNGDPIDGAKVVGLFLSTRPFDGADVLLTAQLSDGRFGAYRAHVCTQADDRRCGSAGAAGSAAIAE